MFRPPSQNGDFSNLSFKNHLRLSYEHSMRSITASIIGARSYLSLISLSYVIEWAHSRILSHIQSNVIDQEQSRLDFVSRQRQRIEAHKKRNKEEAMNVYRKQIATLNMGLGSLKDRQRYNEIAGKNDKGGTMRNGYRPLRIFSRNPTFDSTVVENIASFLKPKTL